MNIILIISLLSFILYNYLVIKDFGIPHSISSTYYKLEEKKKNLGWLFTSMCWISGGLLLPVMLQFSSINSQFLAFLACASLLFVGAAPQFKLKLEGNVHYTSAIICGLCALIWSISNCIWMLVPIILYLIYIYYRVYKGIKNGLNVDESLNKLNPEYWAEVLIALITYITTFITIINN